MMQNFIIKLLVPEYLLDFLFTILLSIFHFLLLIILTLIYYLLFSIIVYLSWINELNLSIHRKIKSLLLIKIFFFFNILFYCIMFFDFVMMRSNFDTYITFYLLFQLAFTIYHIDLNFINLKNY